MTAPTITAFLLARIEEDEAVARAADVLGQIADRITTSACQEFADHVARHDPARVLRECAAKRAIVEPWTVGDWPEIFAIWGNPDLTPPDRISEALATLRALAAVYADHPDYDAAWAL